MKETTLPPSDPRGGLLAQLDRYAPIDDNDHRQAARLRAFVLSTPHCFDRRHLEGHVTGSAWLVDAAGERVLLTHHRKLDKWLQLGGHADGDPDVLAVALREAEEESGLKDLAPLGDAILDLDVHPIPARPDEPAHWHYDVRFVVQATGSTAYVVSPESHDLAWRSIADLAEDPSETSLQRMARKWLRDRPAWMAGGMWSGAARRSKTLQE
jgi:8-oxo-dGTP pyrophosphatase MutT (NUDIX family)